MPYQYDPQVGAVMSPMQSMKTQAPPIAIHDIVMRRQNASMLIDFLNSQETFEGVDTNIFTTKTADGYDLNMVLYSKRDASSTASPAILHMHGGGMILGSVSTFNVLLNNLVALTGVPMLSVDYRLAPEHSHPTILEDGYTGLTWLRDHAGELNVDPTRIGSFSSC